MSGDIPMSLTRFLVFHPHDWRTTGFATPVRHTLSEESLGNGTVEGVEVIGRKITMSIPAGQNDNRVPVDVVGERWESPELRLLIYSRFTNPPGTLPDWVERWATYFLAGGAGGGAGLTWFAGRTVTPLPAFVGRAMVRPRSDGGGFGCLRSPI
jgi:hypothetical protein